MNYRSKPALISNILAKSPRLRNILVRKASQPVSDGRSYLDAAKKGEEALESIISFYQAEGWDLPQPRTLQLAG